MFFIFITIQTEEFEKQQNAATRLASDSADMLFGTDRMTAALKAHENDSPEKILQGIKDAMSEFVKDVPRFDDITMMCLDYPGPLTP